MFPMALQALRPTARQRRESGAKGRDHSGTFRPRNRALDYVLFPQAIRPYPDLWHAGGAPPNRRYLDRAPRPGHPLVRSVSDRIAMPRPHAPAHRGTDPPGVSQTSFHSPCMEREMPAGQRVRSPHLSTLNQFSSQTGACTPRPRPGSIPFEPQPITPSRRDRRARDRDNIPGEIHPQSSHQRFNIPAKIRPRTSNQRFNIPAKIRPLSPRQKSSIPGDLTPNLTTQPRNPSHSFNPKPPKKNRIPPWHKHRFPSLLQPVSRWHTQKPKIKVKKASNFSGSIGTSANGHPHIPGLGQIHSSLDGFVPRGGPRHAGLCLVEIPPRG